jgi:hypothetical protein
MLRAVLIKYSAQDWETFGLRENCAIKRQTVWRDQAPCEQLSKRAQFVFKLGGWSDGAGTVAVMALAVPRHANLARWLPGLWDCSARATQSAYLQAADR